MTLRPKGSTILLINKDSTVYPHPNKEEECSQDLTPFWNQHFKGKGGNFHVRSAWLRECIEGIELIIDFWWKEYPEDEREGWYLIFFPHLEGSLPFKTKALIIDWLSSLKEPLDIIASGDQDFPTWTLDL